MQHQIVNTLESSAPNLKPPQMDVSAPLNMQVGAPPLTVSPSFEWQDKLFSEKTGVSQRWSSYLFWWLSIYSGGQIGHNEIWTFKTKFDFEGQGESTPKTPGILTKVFCIFCLNLVVLAWKGDDLSCGQAWGWHTHGQTHTQTDTGNDNNRRPKLASGKNIITGSHSIWVMQTKRTFSA